MKNSLKYLKLWQKKRNELPINDDQQENWLEMQSILDKNMPVTTPSGDEGGSGAKGFKLLSLMLISLSAAAITYVYTAKIVSKESHHQIHHTREKQTGSNTDRSQGKRDSAIDSLTASEMTFNKRDSLHIGSPSLLKLPDLIKNTTTIAPASNANDTQRNAPASITAAKGLPALIKTNNFPLLAGSNRNQPVIGNAYGSNLGGALFKNKAAKTLAGTITNGTSGLHGQTTVGNRFMHFNNNSSFNGIRAGASRSANSKGGTRRQLTDDNADQKVSAAEFKGNQNEYQVLPFSIPKPYFNAAENIGGVIGGSRLSLKLIQKPSAANSLSNGKTNVKEKPAKTRNSNPSNMDWGLLAGVNSSGSFTPKNQNSNFYGSSPVDLFFGLSATYNINDKWAVNSQIKLFSPQTIITTYSHANQSRVDSNQSLQITSSRKMYAVSVPLHIVYKANSNVSFMIGPVINIPVKQTNASSTWRPTAIRSDSIYSAQVDSVLNKTKYEQKLNFGLSGGVNISFKRFSFGATYMKSLSGYQVSSGFGNYKSYNGTFQFTIGFRLNKPRP